MPKCFLENLKQELMYNNRAQLRIILLKKPFFFLNVIHSLLIVCLNIEKLQPSLPYQMFMFVYYSVLHMLIMTPERHCKSLKEF